ncbi:hypothetical protein Tco_0457570 [Tanacetum coccineum]
MPLEGIHVDDKLQFVEEPVEIMEREIKRLKRSRIPLVKVRWNSRRGPEFTWEREDSFKQKYPQLFTNRASSSTTRTCGWIIERSIYNELNELRDQAYENSLIYKEKTKKLHDSKIKNRIFNVGDHVLLFNSRLKIFSGKLKSRWSGPFTITEVYPYGTAKLSHADGSNFKVNCHRLKHYYGGDTPPLVIPDLQTFPKDN